MADVLKNLSEELATVVAQAASGVVRVEARRHVPGSGIVWSPDGLIVTAHHVLEQEDKIQVGLPDGQVVSATLVGRDPTTDLALLQAKMAGLSVPAWAEADDVRVGHLVLALGRPGQSVSATLGVVSALGQAWVTVAGGRVDKYLQADAVMYPGFSGGPLVDAAGRILGVNTSALRRAMSVTIPTATVRGVIQTLQTKGRISRGYLGVGTHLANLPAALAGQLGQDTGLLVASVAPGGPAEQAGLLLGDTIVALGGQPVRYMDDLVVFLSTAQVGSSVPVRIVRGGQLMEVPVVLGDRS